jgi:hypothetical protein
MKGSGAMRESLLDIRLNVKCQEACQKKCVELRGPKYCDCEFQLLNARNLILKKLIKKTTNSQAINVAKNQEQLAWIVMESVKIHRASVILRVKNSLIVENN